MLRVNTIKGFENVQDYYYCNRDGEIWSYNGVPKNIGTLNKKTGYKRVSLYLNNGRQKTYNIHRIIATGFIPNPDNKRDVNHKNHIKTDNRVENLEWTTHKENTGNNKIWCAKHDKAMSKKVMIIDKTSPRVIVCQSLKQCAKYLEVDPSTIHKALKHNYNVVGKYKLKYL